MAYKKHPQRSRRYKRSDSNSHHHHDAEEKSIQPIEPIKPIETVNQPEKRSSNPFSFLTSLLGTGEKTERSGSPLINILGHEIFFDDVLLVGIIFLLMTEKDKDEILLIVLAYLLLDIF